MAPSSLTSAESMRIATLALFSNLVMGVAKIAGGRIHRSQALTADGLDSVGDSVADLTTIAVIFLSSQYQFSKLSTKPKIIEGFGATIIGLMIIASGYSVGRNALASQFPTNFGQLRIHDDRNVSDLPSLQAAWFALASIVVKQYLSTEMMKTAKRTDSSAMAANSKHMRVDSYTGVLTLIAIAIPKYFPAASGSDDICGFFISIMVVKSGIEAIQSGLESLLHRKQQEGGSTSDKIECASVKEED